MSLKSRLRRLTRRAPQVSVLRLYGAIGFSGRFSNGLSDQGMGDAIDRAFDARPAAVALAVNSPGGSPVQSSLIAGRIRARAEEAGIPVFAFCEDAAASGGYWLACAADEIWCDGASILGSIGVISAGFGFQEAIAKLGVERRVHSTGPRKGMLDPFRPEAEEDIQILTRLQGDIQDLFVAHVRKRRGLRLAETELFTGEFWTGQRAVELGLADGIGHLRPVMRAKYGEKVRFSEYGPKRSFSQRLGLSRAESLADDAAEAAASALENRLIWSRLGL